ncbi:hypothetical protein ES706_06100 [subsurface metagenome]
MGGMKNIFRGFIGMAIYIITSMLIPILTFDFVDNMEIPVPPDQILNIDIAKGNIDVVKFWLVALGLTMSGLAFFSWSSPKESRRKVVFGILLVFAHCFYLWSYKFSGATAFGVEIPGFGRVTFDFAGIVLLYLGAYALIIVAKIWKLIEVEFGKRKEKKEAKVYIPESAFGKDGGAI